MSAQNGKGDEPSAILPCFAASEKSTLSLCLLFSFQWINDLRIQCVKKKYFATADIQRVDRAGEAHFEGSKSTGFEDLKQNLVSPFY